MSIVGRPGFMVPHYAPVITSSATISLAENINFVISVVAIDPDAHAPISYSIVGGADQALFSINSSNGSLAFSSAPNFESPSDSNHDNVYIVTVRATSQGQTIDQTISVSITDVNEAPTITSGSSFSAAENQTAVTTCTATDPEGHSIAWSIVGGPDSSKFSISSSTGVLTFNSAPDFEAPGDSNGDNVYGVTVRASDGTNNTDQGITVTVTDVLEVTPGSSTNDSGSGNFTIPAFHNLDVEVWGSGASGGQGTLASTATQTNAGAASSCSTLGMTANGGGATTGGSATAAVTQAAAATSSGGNVGNLNGGLGGADTGRVAGLGQTGGVGGAAPAGANAAGATVSSNGANPAGNPGVNPGDGGSGAASANNVPQSRGYAGGNSGAYCKSSYTTGQLTVGASLAWSVGAGGAATNGNAGHSGRVKFTWS